MYKRPWAGRPEADGTAAHVRGGASLRQESAEPPCLCSGDNTFYGNMLERVETKQKLLKGNIHQATQPQNKFCLCQTSSMVT